MTPTPQIKSAAQVLAEVSARLREHLGEERYLEIERQADAISAARLRKLDRAALRRLERQQRRDAR